MKRSTADRLRSLSWQKLISAIKRSHFAQWLWSDRYLIIYRIDRADGGAITTPAPMNANCLADLEKFDESVSWISYQAFMNEAKERIAEGEMVFTTAPDGYLAHYGWLVPLQEKGYFPFVDQAYVYPPHSTVMYNGFCHPKARGRGLHHVSLRSRVAWAFAKPEINYVYGAIEIDNFVSRHCSEKLGLRPYEVLYRKCRFGRVTKGTLPPSFVSEYDKERLAGH